MGDAPGMNACIRAVVRSALYFGIEVYGIERGYQGLIDDEMVSMDMRSVSDIVQRGGTKLRTARCLEMLTKEGQKKAVRTLEARGIEGLVVIGGDGSFGSEVPSEDYGSHDRHTQEQSTTTLNILTILSVSIPR